MTKTLRLLSLASVMAIGVATATMAAPNSAITGAQPTVTTGKNSASPPATYGMNNGQNAGPGALPNPANPVPPSGAGGGITGGGNGGSGNGR